MMQYKDREIRKIRIIGGAGSGKTTLSKEIGELLGLPIISLDHSSKKIKKMSFSQSQKYLSKKMFSSKWIIEGVQTSYKYKNTFEQADLIIFLDYSLSVRRKRLIKRYLSLNFTKTESKRNCSLNQLYILCRWNRQFDAEKEELTRTIKKSQTDIVRVSDEKEVTQTLEKIKKLIGEDVKTMDLTKLNFFNRKIGEKYKYEYNYDADYDYDYDYDYAYEEVIPKAFKNEKQVKSSLPIIKKEIEQKEELEQGVEDKVSEQSEVEQLKLEIAEQNEYIKNLMIIKSKSDTALEQLRTHLEAIRQTNNDLKEKLGMVEEENNLLKQKLNESMKSKEMPLPVVEKSNTEDADKNQILLIKHLKASQAQVRQLEGRLDKIENVLETVDLTAVPTVVRKRSSKSK